MLEGPTFAFFWVEDGAVHAPPLAEGILDSITRRRVLDAIDVVQEHCTLDRLRERAEEAFAAGTGIEVAPVLGDRGRARVGPSPARSRASAMARDRAS